MARFVIDGSFLLEPPLGVQRYALEVTKQLDKMKKDLQLSIVVPEGSDLGKCQKLFKNIPVCAYGRHTGRMWEQLDFPRFLKKHKAKGVSLCNTLPLLARGGLVCIHDIVFKTHPEYFTEPGDWHEILFRKMMYSHAFKSAEMIVTVSEFSKNEILRNYKPKKANITVAGNAWQHYNTVDIDETIFVENGRIKKGEYYYYLASLAPNKNLWWILENAKKHPDDIYVLSGKPLGDKSGVDSLSNVICTGYVSDARAKALMKHCKAFIFPSTYEGFGIPPMEALCMGAKTVVGDIECLREIYGESVYYIDVKNPDIDIDGLIEKECAPASDVLSRFSWERTAAGIAEVLTKDK